MDPKPGWQTTEFWVTIVGTVLLGVFPDAPKEALIAVVGYAVSRGMAKWNPAAPKKGK